MSNTRHKLVLSVEDVKKRVAEIESLKHDNEDAHSKEDDLYEAVLKAVVGGNDQSVQMAWEALQTKSIDFERWCA